MLADAATTGSNVVPFLLGAGGLTTVATLLIQAWTSHGGREQQERQMIAEQWTTLLTAAVKGHRECLDREAELRDRVEQLERQMYRGRQTRPSTS